MLLAFFSVKPMLLYIREGEVTQRDLEWFGGSKTVKSELKTRLYINALYTPFLLKYPSA